MLEVTKATPLEDHVLRIEFNDGLVGEVDCSFLLAGGLGAALREPALFRQVRVDSELRTMVWPNGLDPAPELLHRHLKAGAAVVSSATSLAWHGDPRVSSGVTCPLDESERGY